MNRVFVLGNATIDVVLNAARLPNPGETLLAEHMVRLQRAESQCLTRPIIRQSGSQVPARI